MLYVSSRASRVSYNWRRDIGKPSHHNHSSGKRSSTAHPFYSCVCGLSFPYLSPSHLLYCLFSRISHIYGYNKKQTQMNALRGSPHAEVSRFVRKPVRCETDSLCFCNRLMNTTLPNSIPTLFIHCAAMHRTKPSRMNPSVCPVLVS